MQELSHEVPMSMSDSQWLFLLNVRDIVEKEAFVRSVYYQELNESKTEQCNETMKYEKGKFLEEKQRKYDAGEIMYGRGFYDYIDIRGKDFRKRLDEKMPQLIFDCRFLLKNSERNICAFIKQIKTVYDYNWFNPNPFRMSIANLYMDDFVANLVKKNWHFAVGPPSTNSSTDLSKVDENFDFDLAEFEDLEEIMSYNSEDNTERHIFAPRITSRGIRSVLDPGIKNEEVAFISKNATRYLGDDISKFKAFVICATRDDTTHPTTSPSVAAADDGFNSYRLPLEKYIKWEQGRKDISFARITNIMKDVYLKESEWKEAFLKHVPEWHFKKRDNEKSEILETKKARLQRINILKEAVQELHFRKIAFQRPEQKGTPKKPRVHRTLLSTLLNAVDVKEGTGDSISGVKLPSEGNFEDEHQNQKSFESNPGSNSGFDSRSDSESSTLVPGDGFNGCLLRCKDEHMMKMDNEWSMDFAFPLVSLLRTNGSVEVAKEKARSICEDNELLDSCFRSCSMSLERKILRLGLQPWRHLCRKLELLMTQFDCWKSNIDTLTLGCYLESHKIRESMEAFTHNQSLMVVESICRDMNILSICSIEEFSKYCGDVSKILLIQLFQSSRDTVIEMLKIRWPVLPYTCNQKIEYYKEEEAQLALLNIENLTVFEASSGDLPEANKHGETLQI
ncbi:hypothetical protein FO519_005219 [Halicephalobus sp. NKZ332]|nr:hypothetical protein FO519_005219 [Halicephalobus sp. NKZ332]